MLSKSGGETIHNNNNVESCLFIYIPRDHVLSCLVSNPIQSHHQYSSRSIFYYLDKCNACLLGYMLVLLVCLPLNATHRRSNTSRGAAALKACYGQLYLLVAVESWLRKVQCSVLVSSRVVLLWIKHIITIIIIITCGYICPRIED